MFLYLRKVLLISSIVLLFTSCIAKIDTENKSYKSCELTTSKMKLTYENINAINCGSDPKAGLACLALFGVIIPVGSTIATGSIVLVNNTIHWLEYQGKCDEDEVQNKLKNMKRDIKN